ncbi:MAG: hypothetical protein ABSG17_20910 [Spirochaetia bacterium]
MSSRAVVFLFLVASIAPAWSGDWGPLVASSDRHDDGLIISLLDGADFQTKVEMLEALGTRKDPYAADIISWLLAAFSKTGEFRAEYLLRVTMRSLFGGGISDADLAARLDANAAVVDDLVNATGRFHDPQLKGTIIDLFPRLGSAGRSSCMSALMETAAEIVSHLRESGGLLSSPDMALAFDCLAVIQEMGSADFLELTQEMARLSRDASLVKEARQVSHLLAGG